MKIPTDQQAMILNLARGFVRDALECRNQPPPLPAGSGHSNAILQDPAGCFVSLHTLHDHRLRGCVGRIDAEQPLIEALYHASEQVLQDPRFADHPVRVDELSELEIEVSVLSPPKEARGPLDFDPAEQGIYLTINRRTGCFLPQVARDTGWSREQLLDRLCTEKLGLPPSSWRGPGAKLQVFSVAVIGPEPFQGTGI